MDMNEIEKELGNIKARRQGPGKIVDYNVRHAGIKVLASRLLALLFFAAMVLFGLYTIFNAETARIDFKVVAVLAIVYLAGGAFIALKLWNTERMGWVALFFVSLAGIGLPILSAVDHGLMAGTLPIIGASLITLVILYWIKDLYRIKKFGDIFGPPQ
ncbi:MAG: hypothetical protein A4E28_02546 [Methanocella sp. PtaU1.Bin125]|nr:MAG: hypothetical protein A4E28_02546 [Methanocella sp. PtaU1.Bin125]